jgi:hypothetical protein
MTIYVVVGIEKANLKHTWPAKAFTLYKLADYWKEDKNETDKANTYQIYATELVEKDEDDG